MLIAAVFTISNQVYGQEKAKWKELEEFHAVMSATFHPSQEGKLEPIKSRSGEMVERAVTWQKSNAPEGFSKKKVKSDLKKLVKQSKELNQLIKNNTADNVIKEKLASLHDVFHTITEKCEMEEHH